MDRHNSAAEKRAYIEVMLKALVWAGLLETMQVNGETNYRGLGVAMPSGEELSAIIDKYNRGEVQPGR